MSDTAIDKARLAAWMVLQEAVGPTASPSRLMTDLAIELFAHAMAASGASRRDELLARLNAHEMMRIMRYRASVTTAAAS
jgi:hypothetical protein